VNAGVQSSGYSTLRQPASPGRSAPPPVVSVAPVVALASPVLVTSPPGPALPLVGAGSPVVGVPLELSPGTASVPLAVPLVPADPDVPAEVSPPASGVQAASSRAHDRRRERSIFQRVTQPPRTRDRAPTRPRAAPNRHPARDCDDSRDVRELSHRRGV
jgi:hypothetical protein